MMAEGKTTVLVSGWTLPTYQVGTVIGKPDLKLMLMISLYIPLQPYSTVNLSINALLSRTDTTPACETNLTTSAAAMPIHVRVRSYSLQFPSDHNTLDLERIESIACHTYWGELLIFDDCHALAMVLLHADFCRFLFSTESFSCLGIHQGSCR